MITALPSFTVLDGGARSLSSGVRIRAISVGRVGYANSRLPLLSRGARPASGGSPTGAAPVASSGIGRPNLVKSNAWVRERMRTNEVGYPSTAEG